MQNDTNYVFVSYAQ